MPNFSPAGLSLGREFFTPQPPTPLPAPYWVGRSRAMARELGLEDEWAASDEALHIFTGNTTPDGTTPLASVYSGHQFGVWAGQLGDGRAILLGELNGQEVQLKGAGRTPYSRMGDGRAVLRSSIREFLCSEAMHALGIPTSRALCITGSDAPVRREEIETAAVVTRTALSFIRFGHFEHYSYSGQTEQLRTLADRIITRFYPECQGTTNPYAALLEAVSIRTAELLAQWQSVGFCHGVMNTDNMSILGLTLDYGPFQFLDGFNPHHICNHSDHQGRYAYNRQPNVAYWNLFCLGQALMPLLGDEEATLTALEPYKSAFATALETRFCAKLGLVTPQPEDRELVEQVLQLMAAERVDYTLFWHHLSHSPTTAGDLFIDRPAFERWLQSYIQRPRDVDLMRRSNPKFVLRNHLGELAIQAAREKNFSVLGNLSTVLASPYDDHPAHSAWADFPPDWASTIEISCSS